MYIPYLRGKQFELIALRELADLLSHDGLIFPFVEPVNPTTVTLEKTIEVVRKNKGFFGLVLNPEVGNIKTTADRKKLFEIYSNSTDIISPAIIISKTTDIQTINTFFDPLESAKVNLILTGVPKDSANLPGMVERQNIDKILVDEKNVGKRLLRQLRGKEYDIVLLVDRFNAMKRNVDYAAAEDEFFSDDHLFYKEEGFSGFSDYLTIGEEYSDTGFLPYAVAIHITYIDKNEDIRIRHFVSDDCEDSKDVAGKFGQALSKLIDFVEKHNLNTRACQEFRRLFKEEAYPGLGSIKKLSIMHHIELMYDFLKTKR